MSQVNKIIIGASVLNDRSIKEFIEGVRLEGYEVETTQEGVIITGDDLGPLLEVWENIERSLETIAEHISEAWRKLFENEAEKQPRVNKRPDYSQKAKDDTRGEIKRIRTQRSREKK